MEHRQSVTIDQLARLYQVRNEANKRMSQALRAKSGVVDAKTEASLLNRAYVDALKVYKRQQKTTRKAREKTTSAQKQQPSNQTRTLLDIKPGQTIRCMYCGNIKPHAGSSGFHAHRVCRECVQKLQTTAKDKT